MKHLPLCHTAAVFQRRQVDKRDRFLSLRFSEEERQALDWIAEELSRREGGKVSATDVVREAVGQLYKKMKRTAAASAGKED